MVLKWAVPGCSSGYFSRKTAESNLTTESGGKIHFHKFPPDETVLAKWIKRIPRKEKNDQ
jgi:hypothetical protein